jgi:hypothetical protein
MEEVLGKTIVIPYHAYIHNVESGYKVEYYEPTIQITIGIGKNHHANLIMCKDDWEALNSGEPINISCDEIKDVENGRPE